MGEVVEPFILLHSAAATALLQIPTWYGTRRYVTRSAGMTQLALVLYCVLQYPTDRGTAHDLPLIGRVYHFRASRFTPAATCDSTAVENNQSLTRMYALSSKQNTLLIRR